MKIPRAAFRNHGARSRLIATAGTFLLGLAAPAMAQDAETAALGGVEEIIVTAQKRSESIQSVPSSILAMNADTLTRLGVDTVFDLSKVTPNLQMTPHPNSGTTARIFLRGVGNNDDQLTYDPGVAIYLDGVYVSRSQGLGADIADIERVEVLRGPQGTLYGRNTTGGAINYITKAPSLNGVAGSAEAEYGSRRSFRAKASLNAPLAPTLAATISYLHAQRNGFVKNPGTGAATWGAIDRNAYRADLLWKPQDGLSLRYSYDRSEIGDSPQFIARVPLYPARGERPRAGNPAVRNLRDNDSTVQGHTWTADWEASEALTVRSITGYRKVSEDSYQDYNTGAFGAVPIIITTADVGQRQFTEELQVLGTTLDDRLKYIFGAYYYDESGDSFDTSAVIAQPVAERWVTVDNKAYALFGQATWSPDFAGKRLHITVGGRGSWDKRRASLRQRANPNGVPGPTSAAQGRKFFSKFSPAFTLAYDLTADIHAYAKVADGYKTGGFNVRASSLARFSQGFGDESLTSYEAGLKTDLLDRRLRLNLAGFISDYRDIQVGVASDPNNPTISDVLNAGKGKIKGVELDITAKPTPNWALRFSYGYLNAHYSRIIDATGRDVSGIWRFTTSPKYRISAGTDYTLPRINGADITASLNYSLTDDYYSVATISPTTYRIKGYGLVDARLALNDLAVGAVDVTVALWGRNLTDETYYIGHFNGGVPSAIFGEPRSYGVSVSARF